MPYTRFDNNSKDQCLWVPASVNHKVDTTGLSRYSFFVYGGVRVQPRANIQKNGLGLPGGNRVDGGFLGRSGKSNRFTVLVPGASKEQVRTMLKEGKLPVTAEQVKSVKYALRSGAMNNIRIHKMNNGNIHVACERPGHTSGFQRMSFKYAADGTTKRVVQTAFDANSKIVHQKPGQAKNNLYDVKK